MDWVSRNTRRGVGPDAASIGHGVVGFISATRVGLDPGEISRGKEAIDAAAVAASLELGAYLVELSPRHRDEPWTPAVRDLVHMARTGRLRGIVLDQVEALAADRDDALLVAVALVECGVRIVEARPRRPGVASRARPSARRRSSRTLAGAAS